MALITPDAARAFAAEWVAAWNAHDLDRILSHYADDIEFSSPMMVQLANVPSGMLTGKSALREYWTKGLARLPQLHFELVDVLAGVDRVVIYYRGHRGMVAECFVFGADGRVSHATACYA